MVPAPGRFPLLITDGGPRQSLRDRVMHGLPMLIAIHTPNVPKTSLQWPVSLKPQVETPPAPLLREAPAYKG
jgi:hypothetical protein